MPQRGAPTRSFTAASNGMARQLTSPVRVGQHIDPKSGNPVPQGFGPQEFRALWDTGASGSVITPKVASACGLAPISLTRMTGVTGSALAPVYLVSLWLPNKVFVPAVRVAESQLADCDVLIGMDIIGQGDFAVTCMDHHTVFTFRLPSVERIDFVTQTSETVLVAGRLVKMADRNDSCPCGSGKKFKHCCGR